MIKYHKIQTIYLRDMEGDKPYTLQEGVWSKPEFEYLKDLQWEFTEKVDGTNIRILINNTDSQAAVEFRGKSDNAQLHGTLVQKLGQYFPDTGGWDGTDLCIYGEGFGAGIQKGGAYGNIDFIAFDAKIGGNWVDRETFNEICERYSLRQVPIIGAGTLTEAVEVVRGGFDSVLGDLQAEGLVARPLVEMYNQWGERIITKIKTVDFKERGPALKDGPDYNEGADYHV